MAQSGRVRSAGPGAEELLGQKFTRFVPAEAQDAFYLYSQQVLHSGSKQTGEFTLQSATGRAFTSARLEGKAARYPVTHQTQCRLSLSDMTERKAAERRRELTSALSALFAQKTTASAYLRSVVELIRQWSGAQLGSGIRLMNDQQEIPYEAWAGFGPAFHRAGESPFAPAR